MADSQTINSFPGRGPFCQWASCGFEPTERRLEAKDNNNPTVPRGSSVGKFKRRRDVRKTYVKMPGKVALNPLPPGTKQPGLAQSLLYSGSRFQGHQKSKGNRYDVEVVLKVSSHDSS